MHNAILWIGGAIGIGVGLGFVQFILAPACRRRYRRWRHMRQLRRVVAAEPREPVRLTSEQVAEQVAQAGLTRESAAAKQFITRYVDDLLQQGVSPQDAYREAEAVYHESFSGWG